MSTLPRDSANFLNNVSIKFNGKKIEEYKEAISLNVNKKNSVDISIVNSEKRMAKNIEIGFIFPNSDFIIEPSKGYSKYTSETEQIFRHNVDMIHGNTNLLSGELVITPLKKGDYEIGTFLKAENIEAKHRSLTVNVQ